MDPRTDDQEEQYTRSTLSQALEETKAIIGKISWPTALPGPLFFLRAMISMLFLGYLGEQELVGGSLAIKIMNVTGYSVISRLAMGKGPICGQAYAARQWRLLSLTIQRTVLLLFFASIPMSLIWLNMKSILLWCGQDEAIASMAHTFIAVSIPDLFILSFLDPLRIYLRAQNITILPFIRSSACISVLLHAPLNFLLVVHFKLGIAGVAIAMVWTNFNLFLLLFSYVFFTGIYEESWVSPGMDCLQGWSSILVLAVVKVFIEWIQKIQEILNVLFPELTYATMMNTRNFKFRTKQS